MLARMRRSLLISFGLVSLTLTVFWQTVDSTFVNFDDDVYVTENPHVRGGLHLENVVWAFRTNCAANYHPLTWISLMLDQQVFGTDPGGFHLTNVLWHTLNVVLLFAVLSRLTGAIWKSAFVAALFAVHPIHVESVAWISERKDVLSAFFGLLAIGAYVRYTRELQTKWLLVSAAAFTGSLLAKQTLVTLPFLLLLLDYWPLRRWELRHPRRSAGNSRANASRQSPAGDPLARPSLRRHRVRLLLVEKSLFFGLAIAFSVAAAVVHQAGDAAATLKQFSVSTRCANAVVAYVLYVKKALWPRDLAVLYPHPGNTIPPAHVAAAVLLLMCVTVAVVILARKRPYLPTGWFWYLVSFVPMIGIVQVGGQQMADRYAYIPFVGLYVALAWCVESLAPERTRRRIAAIGLAVSALVALTVQSRVQTGFWRDSITLFERAIAVTENNATAHNNLGKAYFEAGRGDLALRHLQKAVAIEPESASGHCNFGIALCRQRQFDRAIEHFQTALKIEPNNAAAYMSMGNAFLDMGRLDPAVENYRKSLNLDPDNAVAHYNMGRALSKQDQPRRAIHHYQTALRIDPQYAMAHNNLGVLLFVQNRRDSAVQHFREALRLDPSLTIAKDNLRRALSASD